ncbi:MAG: undecaprenyl-diphosphate phosphatase [Clostridiales bacterium]|nr:undecaprenyl-diphosphate phosphatase [Clostridiales bacterium]
MLSVITAIFQAIGQVLTFIFPVSESGHSAVFHDFSSRYTNNCSELTGLIHIGMAIGILIAFYKVFLRLIYEFVSSGRDVFTKRLDVNKTSNSRKFTYFTFIPYIFMLFYLIPVGKTGNVYDALHYYSYDGNLISEGICFLITASLLMAASVKLSKTEKSKSLSLICAVVISLAVFFAVPVSGLSLCACVISIALLFGINKKTAFRYFISLSVPILLVEGIVEIVNCVTYVNVLTGIIGFAVAAVFSFFASKLLLAAVKNNYLKYFSYYCYGIGAITFIIGVAELIIN